MSDKIPIYLSKSDFILALNCRTKLYYKKKHYPTISDEYMDLLRDGGYMIGKIAQLLFDGVAIEFDGNIEKACTSTLKLLQKNKDAVLYEATFSKDNLLVRVDVLEKKNDVLKIIEVKSTSFDINKYTPGTKPFFTRYKEKLFDVAFQYYVLKKIFPNTTILASLMMPDKNKTIEIDNLPTFFNLRKDNSGKFYNVEFSGDIKALRKSNFLTEVDVTEIVIAIQTEIESSVNNFIIDLISQKEIIKYKTLLSKSCRECEFQDNESKTRNGFKECWGKLADVEPHIFDLYYMGTIGGTKEPLVNKLISQEKVSLYDIPEEALKGERGVRQSIQLKYTKENTEWYSEELPSIIRSVKYPLYFIDFEASLLSVPYHKGMRPYEKIAFQWSCHKIEKQGQEPTHYEWININDIFPNFEFAETLKNCIKEDGTVLTWASYENTTLKEIKDQMYKYNYKNDNLKIWLEKLIKTKENTISRIIDLNDVTLKHYFHPLMKGRTSIKVVLPAVWQSNDKLHKFSFSKKYFQIINNNILEPYQTLPKIDIVEQAEVVNEGTGAMMAYQEMLYGVNKNDSTVKDNWKKLLLQYCELDTAAMVLVWKHWENILNINN